MFSIKSILYQSISRSFIIFKFILLEIIKFFFNQFYNELRDNIKNDLMHENSHFIFLKTLISIIFHINTHIYKYILKRKFISIIYSRHKFIIYQIIIIKSIIS